MILLLNWENNKLGVKIKMKRLEKIRMLDRLYFLFIVTTCILAGVIIVFNQLYIESEQLFLQYAIIFVLSIVGILIWRKHKA